MNFIKSIFGGKEPWKSLTAWGIMIYVVLGKGLAAACGCNETTGICDETIAVASSAFCLKAGAIFQGLGGIMTVLGIRKAATTVPKTPAP